MTSAEVFPEFREYERLSTALLNAALVTVMDTYLQRFSSAVRELGISVAPRISQSAGGLMSVDMARRLPITASLSGPAAGVVGAARRGQVAGFVDLITLDVGGTSTDVSLVRDSTPGIARDRSLAGFPLRVPLIDVNAVGAGGGSIAWLDRDGLMKVGPRSAGAQPGPACYGLGGEEATLTDANVCLGRLHPLALLDGRMPIRADLAHAAVAKLAHQIDLDVIETARGIVQVACANIVRAIRTVSVERGHDPSKFALFAYGGAGPLHAVEVARELGIERVIIPPNPGILCAEGLLSSDLRMDFVKTLLVALQAGAGGELLAARDEVMAAAKDWFVAEDIHAQQQVLRWSADMRYRGQNYEISIPLHDADFAAIEANSVTKLLTHFHAAHEQAYGFAARTESVQVVSVKVQACGLLDKPDFALLPVGEGTPCAAHSTRAVCFYATRWRDTGVYTRSQLQVGQHIEGPAVVEQMDSTTLLFPGDRALVDEWGNLVMELNLEPEASEQC
jgi:N-methylhydantoinase A